MSTSDAWAFNVARQIRAGLVTVQKVGTEPLADVGPGGGQEPGWGSQFTGIGQSGAFGGYKQSDLGRERGRHGLEDFTEVKNLACSLTLCPSRSSSGVVDRRRAQRGPGPRAPVWAA